MEKRICVLCAVCAFVLFVTGCSQPAPEKQAETTSVDEEYLAVKEDVPPKEGNRPWEAEVLVPEASGSEVYGEGDILLDTSNAAEGYVMLNYSGSNEKVKLQIVTPEEVTYTYEVSKYGSYQAYPLSGGNGTYGFTVYEAADVEKKLYAASMTQEVSVNLSDEFKTFLYPNCYVDFDASSACVKKGEELAKGCGADLDVVASVYDYVTDNITYDYDKAETVQTGYAPYPDDTLASGKGICFDYASLMAAMLRSQRIPTKLEVGYVGELYHAWLSCYIDDKGWVDDLIEFDGTSWTMMDPTMASSSGTKEVLRLEKESGYITKYTY